MRFLWDFVLGPVLALLPARWRRGLGVAREVDWTRAGTASGIYEAIAAIVLLGYWYMYEMGRMVGNGVDQAATGKLSGVTDIEIGGAALTVFAMHPVTWFLFYLFLEGAVRLCSAAFTENVVGILPLSLLDRILFLVSHPSQTRAGVAAGAGSFAGAIRERARIVGSRELPDALERRTSGTDEIVEIRASRRKTEWVAPKVVRMGEVYYRLEESWEGKGERPYCYRLRRLAAGVSGRRVILYEEPVER